MIRVCVDFFIFSAWLLFVVRAFIYWTGFVRAHGRGPSHLQSRAKIRWNLKSMEMGSILVV
jgi:hypothetical protein